MLIDGQERLYGNVFELKTVGLGDVGPSDPDVKIKIDDCQSVN